MQQLRMYKDDKARADETLPVGFSFAVHTERYVEQWVKVMDGAIGKDWTAEKFNNSMLGLPGLCPEGIFYVVNDKHEAVATASGVLNNAGITGTGQLHMVAVGAAHRGLKLGAPISAKAINYLYSKGMDRIMLTTDDFRIPAVKVYLGLGFIPVLHDETMHGRWIAVAEQIGRTILPAYADGELIENIL